MQVKTRNHLEFQYDKSPLTITGGCQANVRINICIVFAVFVVVRRCAETISSFWKGLDGIAKL